MADPRQQETVRQGQRRAVVRTALVLGAVAISIYTWAIVSHL